MTKYLFGTSDDDFVVSLAGRHYENEEVKTTSTSATTEGNVQLIGESIGDAVRRYFDNPADAQRALTYAFRKAGFSGPSVWDPHPDVHLEVVRATALAYCDMFPRLPYQPNGENLTCPEELKD